ncbi:MAG: LOG family protein [Planctomycetota bacterium]
MTDSNSPNPVDQSMIAEMNKLVAHVGGNPDSIQGKSVREIMHTGLKLITDEANLGEVKLISRALKELRYALKVFRPYDDHPKISVFGSARTPEDHPDYQAAVRFSRTMAESGWMVITGAGDGIMRAGHAGSGRESAFGVAIRLPFETNANDVIVGDPKLVTFRYFFTRKLMFMWMSHAVALFPGGFGTQDEGFEALTLIQTGKAPLVPIVMIDAPGTHAAGTGYWMHWDNYVTKSLLENGWISPEDKNLYFVTDDPAAAARHVSGFYRNYHSQRFVRDDLVLRIRRPLTEKQLDQLSDEYASLIVEGKINQGGPLESERDHLQLPRLWFHHTKHGYGKLRAMIDQINKFDIENAG